MTGTMHIATSAGNSSLISPTEPISITDPTRPVRLSKAPSP
jgi:hypothetical protein